MAFIKKNLLMLILGVVSVGAISTAVWAYVAGDEILKQMQSLDGAKNRLRTQRGKPQNLSTIDAKRREVEEKEARLKKTLESALAVQSINAFYGAPRELLVADILPAPKDNSQRFEFKLRYKAEFDKLLPRMKARFKAEPDEVAREQAIIESQERGADSEALDNPWRPEVAAAEKKQNESTDSLEGFLRRFAEARAAEKVARGIYMYVDRDALRMQPMAESSAAPNDIEIWHAQMSLWIQQDIVVALSSVNEKRAESLRAAKREYETWVAHMPVKHLKSLGISGRLGTGGGLNQGGFAPSFTTIENDKDKFVVPLQLELVIEEAAINQVLDSLCTIGFYTPIRVDYEAVEADPLQREYLYGDDPVVFARIDLEAYYFREVFDKWIPKDLKRILETPGARDPDEMMGGRG